jgi:hypothetical protein
MKVRVHAMILEGKGPRLFTSVRWFDVDSPSHQITTFWTRGMNWVPDIHATYEFTPPSQFELVDCDQITRNDVHWPSS